MNRITVAALAFVVSTAFMQTASARVSDTDIVEAYEYMLGRWLVLRQEALDFKEGFQWNEIIHREPGGVAWANPNLDVAYSEAWVAVDDKSCTLIELPEIKGRYHTVQALNGWGEVTANLNERNYPRHPFGKFALCLKGAKVTLPKGTQRVDLPSRKSRILARIELGANPADAISLQKKITMKATGVPKIEKAVVEPAFTNDKLPGIEAFEKTDEILASEADINPGMTGVQENARSIAAAAADPVERARMDDVIRKKAIPTFLAEIPKSGKTVNGWIHPRIVGNFRSDYLMRTITNFTGIWANNSKEAVYFGALGIDGSQTYLQTFPEDALPTSKARYFWSVVAVDGEKYRVIPNRLNRFLFNKQSALEFNPDGSLTLAFAPKQPDGVPESNWLPTPAGKKYNMTYRFYGPSADITSGKYYPPPLAKE
jgi:hypothetical protein